MDAKLDDFPQDCVRRSVDGLANHRRNLLNFETKKSGKYTDNGKDDGSRV